MSRADEDARARALDGAIEALGKRSTFSDGARAIERAARARDEGDARVSVALARAGRRVATTLKSRYGDARAEAWDVGVRAIEACRDAVGGSDREALVAALATLAETREATATAPREDETAPKTKTKTKDETMDENVDGVVNEALRLILAARRRSLESLVDGLERDFDESEGSRAAASTVSVEALRYRKPRDDEVGMKCSICFDCYATDEVVVAMPCSASHVFHERCVKEWLARDDSCPLCRSSLPVWLGRPQYS